MNGAGAWITCEVCEKRSFASKRDAKKAAATIDRRCRPYPCPVSDNLWHFGHLPTAVRMGDFDRHTLRRMRGQNP